MTFAMANGIALERLLEPEAVQDDLCADDAGDVLRGPASRAGHASSIDRQSRLIR